MRASPPPAEVRTGSNVAGAQIRVDHVSPELLKAPERRLRIRSRVKLAAIARSISEFGFLIPIVVDPQLKIIAGIGRWEAARELKLTSVPIIRVEHLTDAQLRLFAIADNKLPEGVAWDHGELLLEIQEIELIAPELELTSSGLEIAEIDTLYGRARTTELADFDEPAPVEEGPAINRSGDLWQLGRHVLACGDARDAALIKAMVGDRQARLLLSDPPWNLKIEGVVSGNGRVKHADFEMAAGEMTRDEFQHFLAEFLTASLPQLMDGALAYLFMDWRNLDTLCAAANHTRLEQKNLLVWCKDSPGMGSLYRSQHELIGLFKHGTAAHLNNIQLGRHGRNRSNVLFYPGMNGFGKGRSKALQTHPTCKPVSLLADIMLDASAPGDLILDPFGGSGSTLIAGEKVDRDACLVELHPPFADAIVRRFEALTHEEAVHLETGQTFAELAAERISDGASND